MDIQKFTEDLFSPSIAWDTPKRRIVEQLTEKECVSLARRTTYNLRSYSPEIRRGLSNIKSIRQRYAKLRFTHDLITCGLLEQTEVDQYERMSRLVDAQFNSTTKVIRDYQKESAFRLCCMVRMAGLSTEAETESLYADLDALVNQQASLDDASLLKEVISIYVKRGSKYPEFNSAESTTELKKKMTRYTHNIREMLENRALSVEGVLVADVLETQISKLPQMSDSIYTAVSVFEVVKESFENLNQILLSQLTVSVIPLFEQYPEFKLNRVSQELNAA